MKKRFCLIFIFIFSFLFLNVNNADAISLGRNNFSFDYNGDLLDYDLDDFVWLDTGCNLLMVFEISQYVLNRADVNSNLIYKPKSIEPGDLNNYYVCYGVGNSNGVINIYLKDYADNVIYSYSLTFIDYAYILLNFEVDHGDYYLKVLYCENNDFRNAYNLSEISNHYNGVANKRFNSDNFNNIYFNFYNSSNYDLGDVLINYWNWFDSNEYFAYFYNGLLVYQMRNSNYGTAYEDGYFNGYSDAVGGTDVAIMLDNRFNDGFDSGWLSYQISADYNNNLQDSYNSGYRSGYQVGFDYGNRGAGLSLTISDLFVSSFNGLFNGIMPILNYKFFGISLLDIISLFGIVGIALICIKLFL